MKGKTKFSKLLALVVCLMLIITMFSTYSFAITEDDTFSITVNGLEPGVTVNAYQITNVNYDYGPDGADQPLSTPYEWVEAVKTWIEGEEAYNSTGKNYVDIDNVFNTNNNAITDDDKKEFYTAMATAIKNGTLVLTPATEAQKANGTVNVGNINNPSESVTFSGLKMGTYLIITDNGYRVYAPTVVNVTPEYTDGTWQVTPENPTIKSSTISITKTVTDNSKDKDNYSTKDTITFRIEADVPQYPSTSAAKKFYISDDLTNGLTLDASSIKVYGDSVDDAHILKEDTNYTKGTTRPDTGNTTADFVLNFNYDTISQYSKIIVTYTATLAQNTNTVIGGTGNTNTAYLDYSNNPYDAESLQTQTDSTKVYTYELDVSKIDKSDSHGLSGAQFELSTDSSRANKLSFAKIDEGKYYVATSGETTLQVDDNGKLYIYGLDVGTYYLTETKAPDEYTLDSTPKAIEIKDEDIDGLIEVKNEEGDGYTEIDKGIYEMSFPNGTGFQLPTTGGIGTTIFAACGIVFVGLGLVLLTVSIKKNKNK